jgi:hypothetical protein
VASWRWLSLAVVSVLVAACSGNGPEPPTPGSTPTEPHAENWPDALSDFRFRWSAEPGVDLAAGSAVPLRAYLESWRIVTYTNDVDGGYPGYAQATPGYLPVGSTGYNGLPQARQMIRVFLAGIDDGERIIGNEDFHVLRTEPIDNGFRAFVCDATFHVYRQKSRSSSLTPLWKNGAVSPSRVDPQNMVVRRIEFSDRDPRAGVDRPPAPTLPQQGSLPAPRGDVFGPWFVTGAASADLWWSTDHPGVEAGSPDGRGLLDDARTTDDAMRTQCLERYPSNAEQRIALATTVLDAPPPIEPAVPGWPR